LLPLHYASHNGNLLSLKFLFSLPGSNINQIEARNQQTLLIIGIAYAKSFIFNYLLNYEGCDPNIKDKYDSFALHILTKFSQIVSIKCICSHLKTNINICKKNQNTLFLVAIQTNQVQTALVLLQYPSIKINLKNSKGISALHPDALGGNVDIVREIFKYPKCEVNILTNVFLFLIEKSFLFS
jgi:ankyrin repeat protein